MLSIRNPFGRVAVIAGIVAVLLLIVFAVVLAAPSRTLA